MEIFVNKGTRFRCIHAHPDWIADRDYYEDDWRAIGGTLFLYGPEIECIKCKKSPIYWNDRTGMCQEDLLQFMTRHDKSIRRLRKKHWSGFYMNIGALFWIKSSNKLNRTSMIQSLDIGGGYTIESNLGRELAKDSMGWLIRPYCYYIFKNGHLVGTAGPIGVTILKPLKHEFKSRCRVLQNEGMS
jgi:hypothetical protein